MPHKFGNLSDYRILAMPKDRQRSLFGEPRMANDIVELTDLEIVAVSKLFGATRVNDARATIANDNTQAVDFTIRITGSVSRGVAIEDTTKSVTDKLNLDREAILFTALKKLGITAAAFKEAHDAAEAAALKKLTKEQAAVKPRTVAVKGRDGDITAQLDVTKKK